VCRAARSNLNPWEQERKAMGMLSTGMPPRSGVAPGAAGRPHLLEHGLSGPCLQGQSFFAFLVWLCPPPAYLFVSRGGPCGRPAKSSSRPCQHKALLPSLEGGNSHDASAIDPAPSTFRRVRLACPLSPG